MLRDEECLCKGPSRPPARGLCCRGHSHGQWPSVFRLCLAPPNPSKPGLAASGPVSSRAGPIPSLPVHGSASVCSRDPDEPAREPTHASLCPWPLALVTVQLGPSPWGQPRALCLDCGSQQSWGCHCRAPFTARAVAPGFPRSKGVSVQHRGLAGDGGLVSWFPDGSD